MLREWLFTPVVRIRSPKDLAYNTAHSVTCCTIERCIGILKRRWHCPHTELRVAPDRACQIFLCMCCPAQTCHRFQQPHGSFYLRRSKQRGWWIAPKRSVYKPQQSRHNWLWQQETGWLITLSRVRLLISDSWLKKNYSIVPGRRGIWPILSCAKTTSSLRLSWIVFCFCIISRDATPHPEFFDREDQCIWQTDQTGWTPFSCKYVLLWFLPKLRYRNCLEKSYAFAVWLQNTGIH
jgi:hypothetical protein